MSLVEKNSLQPLELFYCYAREDRTLRDALDAHLAGLHRSGLIKAWYDGEISPGVLWEEAIKMHLKSAQIILLLVSADFLFSDYCYIIEMIPALERHKAGKARVIPVILRPCDWQGTPFAKLQVLPTEAKPITSWTNQDEALEDVAKGIRQVVNEFLFSHSLTSITSKSIQTAISKKKHDKPIFSETPPTGGNLNLFFDDIDKRYYFLGMKSNEQVICITKNLKILPLGAILSYLLVIFLFYCCITAFSIGGVDLKAFTVLLFFMALVGGIMEYFPGKVFYIITNERIIAATGKHPIKDHEILLESIKSVKITDFGSSIKLLLKDGKTHSLEHIDEAHKAKDAIQRAIYKQIYK